MNYKEIFENYLQNTFKEMDFVIEEITETPENVFCYLDSNLDMDVPTLVLDKKTNEVKSEVVPPFTSNDGEQTIWSKKDYSPQENDFERGLKRGLNIK